MRRTCYDSVVKELSIDLVTVSSVEAQCAACGHPDWAHVLEDVPQALEKRSLCTECEDWHDFTPLPQD